MRGVSILCLLRTHIILVPRTNHPMDRNSTIGLVLIGLVVAGWVFYQSTVSVRDVTPEKTAQHKELQDSVRTAVTPSKPVPPAISSAMQGDEDIVTVETDLLRVRLSSYGGTIRSWVLKNYNAWYGAPVDLIHPGSREYGFDFRLKNGAKVDGKALNFTWKNKGTSFRVKGTDTLMLTATVQADSGIIERTYTFTGNAYDVRTTITLDRMDEVIPFTNRFVNLTWKNGIRYQEKSAVEESNNAVAIVSAGGAHEEYDAKVFNAPTQQSTSGAIDYVATRSKYFAVALKPTTTFDGTVFTEGTKFGAPNDGVVEVYSMSYKLPYRGGRQTHAITLFAGPMNYDILATYGLTDVMNFGFKWIVKPIGEYFMLPVLKLMHKGIANWGVAIIVFSIFMKLLLYPLSIGQMKSAQKMKLLAPEMNRIREKYKDDQASQQQEMMKLYSEYGINPAGGCLPLLLQMPFLYALYAVLNLNVELRQASFLPVWLTDLSTPDVIFSLPFKLPLFNIDKFSGLALLMGATLFIQQKQAVTDPRQKAMVYMMPVMLTLMFSTLPAGLNLYYFMFNIMGIGQQIYMNKFSKNIPTLADLKKAPKKEGWLQKKMREAQELAAQQGRTLPGQRPQGKEVGRQNGAPGKKVGKK